MNRREFMIIATSAACAAVVASGISGETSGGTLREGQVSVSFRDKNGDIIACDWRGPYSRGGTWSMSGREYGACSWFPTGRQYPDGKPGRLDENGREVLLEAFGLLAIAEQLPLEKIETASPAALMVIRRAFEARSGEDPLKVIVRTSFCEDQSAEYYV